MSQTTKPTAAAVLTGSTGNAAKDTPARLAAFTVLAAAAGGIYNEVFNMDAAALAGIAAATATLLISGFDVFVKPRLMPKS